MAVPPLSAFKSTVRYSRMRVGCAPQAGYVNHRGRSLCRRREPRGVPCLSPAQAQRAENCSTCLGKASASYKRPDFRIAADCGRLRFASRPLGISKACRFPSPQSKPHVQTRSQSQSANDPVLISMGSWKRPSFCRTLNRCRLRPASS